MTTNIYVRSRIDDLQAQLSSLKETNPTTILIPYMTELYAQNYGTRRGKKFINNGVNCSNNQRM